MPKIYVGTVGQSVWGSDDGGNTFRRMSSGMWFETDIRALVAHPQRPETLFAGAEDGLYRTDDGGAKWRRVVSPMDGMQIWSIAFGPDPNRMVAGTCPAQFFRSTDGGETWEPTGRGIAQECFGGVMKTRVTAMIPHPTESNVWLAGVEVDGVWKSTDGAQTWSRSGLPDVDIHDLKYLADGTLFAAANNELYRSPNDGASWEPIRVKEHFFDTYCRGMGVAPGNGNLLFAGVGNGPPGSIGAVYKTQDRGDSWTRVPLNALPNSTIWQFASGGSWTLAASNLGQVFRSTDGGENWAKLAWEFGEIRGLVVVP